MAGEQGESGFKNVSLDKALGDAIKAGHQQDTAAREAAATKAALDAEFAKEREPEKKPKDINQEVYDAAKKLAIENTQDTMLGNLANGKGQDNANIKDLPSLGAMGDTIVKELDQQIEDIIKGDRKPQDDKKEEPTNDAPSQKNEVTSPEKEVLSKNGVDTTSHKIGDLTPDSTPKAGKSQDLER